MQKQKLNNKYTSKEDIYAHSCSWKRATGVGLNGKVLKHMRESLRLQAERQEEGQEPE
jgi:hypothetical protein